MLLEIFSPKILSLKFVSRFSESSFPKSDFTFIFREGNSSVNHTIALFSKQYIIFFGLSRFVINFSTLYSIKLIFIVTAAHKIRNGLIVNSLLLKYNYVWVKLILNYHLCLNANSICI